jgi:hypothetical protein
VESPPCRPRAGDAEALYASLISLSWQRHLDEILCRLPIKHIVHTFALAKTWRSRWTTCARLQVVFFSNDPLGAVNLVLSKYTSHFEVFKINFTKKCYSMTEGWLYALANKVVRFIKFYSFLSVVGKQTSSLTHSA